VDARPAGFSGKWLNEILRRRLGFTGAIFSDDLAMQGARRIDGQEVSFTQAALAALAAGCDMVLLCNQSLQQQASETCPIDLLIDGLDQARHSRTWVPSARSEERRLGLLPRSPAIPWDELMVQAEYMQALDRVV
jgi:beta-N-acetylhexosaminidase